MRAAPWTREAIEGLRVQLRADPGAFDALDEAAQRACGAWLRDAFFALSVGERGEEEATLRAVVDALDPEAAVEIMGLGVSFFPTARRKLVRFIDAERLPPSDRSDFHAPSDAALSNLAAVFIDPEELHFRAFENIIPLDPLLADVIGEVSLRNRQRPSKDHDLYTFEVHADERLKQALRRLDELGLYVPPLNAGSRGGARFIFHSAALSDALTEAARRSMPRRVMKRFSHVNPVFRCNRFEPGDRIFHRHRDTPYHDAAREHISRYTVLLYVTGGRGAPTLDVDGVELEALPPMTCVVFDQRHEHEGSPYLEGRKIFLMTELIFEARDLVHEPGIAKLFSTACYMTGESVFASELEAHASACYERAAAARWGGLDEATSEEEAPFVEKTYRGVTFVTDGHDFWFGPDGPELEVCAALAILDYFNCKVDGASFRSICDAEVVRGPRDGAWIPARFAQAKRVVESPIGPLDKALLFPPLELPDPELCCPFHADWERPFDAARCPEISDLLGRAQRFAMDRIIPAPILMMGQEIFIDPSRFVTRGNQLYVLSDEALEPVNFAACWNFGGSPPDYVGVEVEVDAPALLIPPILFTALEGGGRRLTLDLFRNAWMVRHQPRSLPIPRVGSTTPDEAEEGEHDEALWLDVVDPALVRPGFEHDDSEEPWWWSNDALIDEMFARRDPE